MNMNAFLPALLVMSVVTYLVRALPLVFIKKKIQNRFLLSFLHYVPYAVLSAMTVPACFSATGRPLSAIIGIAAAFILALFRRGLLTVAAGATGAVFLTECVIRYLIPLL